MHFSLFGAYWFPFVKGFYIGKVGDGEIDSSLLGIHWSVEADVEEEVLYNTISFDIIWLTLVRNTVMSFFDLFKDKEDKDIDEE